jgi:hypothetical protein
MQSLRRVLGCMDTPDESIPAQVETYNPWSIVNHVFRQLAAEGLHPVLGESGDPGQPAAELLRALGIAPAFESRPHVVTGVSAELARLREAFEDEHPVSG